MAVCGCRADLDLHDPPYAVRQSEEKPKDKDDSWQVSVFLLVLVVIGYGICVGTSVPEENARIQRDIDEHAYVTVHGSYDPKHSLPPQVSAKKETRSRVSFFGGATQI
ncbi:MAG: hypothetical protein ACLUNO_10750 [Oscillospiraceae bacterium]